MAGMRQLLIALILGCLFISNGYTRDLASRSDLVQKTQKRFEDRCQAATANGGAEGSSDAQFMYCQCMPAQVFLLKSEFPEDKAVNVDAFIDRVNYYLGLCSAKLMKKSVASSCRASKVPGQSEKQLDQYCDCVEKKVNAMSDQSIAADLRSQGPAQDSPVHKAIASCEPEK